LVVAGTFIGPTATPLVRKIAGLRAGDQLFLGSALLPPRAGRRVGLHFDRANCTSGMLMA